jgi:GTP pyrophosphokinase
MMRQYELIERVKSYDPAADEDAINRAYVFTVRAHGAQTRASGDPYFSHPIEVAGILTKFKLDSASIVTGLLHDTVEDTVTTLGEIERLFGQEIARLVDGVTKLSRLELQSDEARQAENFRKLVIAMSEDIRVLLVKLADRLHNMRTLRYITSAEKRMRIARETMEIYAPLAERIGIHTVQEELQDLAFAELHPDARESIRARLAFLREKGGDVVARVSDELKRVLAEEGLSASVSGREKASYSIWRKMQIKNIGFEQLSDIMAFRVLVPEIGDCYRALGVIHSQYAVVPGRFKDYISTPKPNRYRSLHTSVIGPEKQRIEIQIRTQEMHEVAELGVAAHWSYKQGGPTTDGKQYRWLRDLLDLLEHASNPEEFLEHTKLAMFQDQVFCFTPRGEIIALPKGGTPVDFAYAVHSEIGDHCVGAKVNGRMMPLRTQLQNGDQVEIVTAKAQQPSPTWERFVVTAKARARIRRFVRMQQRTEFAGLGRTMLEKAFRQAGYDFTEKAVEQALARFKAETAEDLYAQLGAGNVATREVLGAIFPETRQARPDKTAVPRPARKTAAQRRKSAVPIRGLIDGMAIHYAACCHPLPGDRIVGIVSTGKGVTIHTIDCEQLAAFQDQPERWLDVAWDAEAEAGGPRTGRVAIVLNNEPGAAGSVFTVIGRNEGNISNMKVTNRTPQFWEMLIDIEVRDLKHLANIIAALRATSAVSAVDRARG